VYDAGYFVNHRLLTYYMEESRIGFTVENIKLAFQKNEGYSINVLLE
jgi:hypothetical protein